MREERERTAHTVVPILVQPSLHHILSEEGRGLLKASDERACGFPRATTARISSTQDTHTPSLSGFVSFLCVRTAFRNSERHVRRAKSSPLNAWEDLTTQDDYHRKHSCIPTHKARKGHTGKWHQGDIFSWLSCRTGALCEILTLSME